jgi:hypothetical protein
MTSTAVDNAFYSSSTFKLGCLTLRTSRRTALHYIEVNLNGRNVCPPRWTDTINPETNCSESMVAKRDAMSQSSSLPGILQNT